MADDDKIYVVKNASGATIQFTKKPENWDRIQGQKSVVSSGSSGGSPAPETTTTKKYVYKNPEGAVIVTSERPKDWDRLQGEKEALEITHDPRMTESQLADVAARRIRGQPEGTYYVKVQTGPAAGQPGKAQAWKSSEIKQVERYSKPVHVETKDEYTPEEAYQMGFISYREAQQSSASGSKYRIPAESRYDAEQLRQKWGTVRVSPGASAVKTWMEFERRAGLESEERVLTSTVNPVALHGSMLSLHDPWGFRTVSTLFFDSEGQIRNPFAEGESAKIGQDILNIKKSYVIRHQASNDQVGTFVTGASEGGVLGAITFLPVAGGAAGFAGKAVASGAYGMQLGQTIKDPSHENIFWSVLPAATYGASRIVGAVRAARAKTSTSFSKGNMAVLENERNAVAVAGQRARSYIGTGKNRIAVESEVVSKYNIRTGKSNILGQEVTEAEGQHIIRSQQLGEAGKPVGKAQGAIGKTRTLSMQQDEWIADSSTRGIVAGKRKNILGMSKPILEKFYSKARSVKLSSLKSGNREISEYISNAKSLQGKNIDSSLGTMKVVTKTLGPAEEAGTRLPGTSLFTKSGSVSGSIEAAGKALAKSSGEALAKSAYTKARTPTAYTPSVIQAPRVTTRMLDITAQAHSPVRLELLETKQPSSSTGVENVLQIKKPKTRVSQDEGIAQIQRLQQGSKVTTRSAVSTRLNEVQLMERAVSNRMVQMMSPNLTFKLPENTYAEKPVQGTDQKVLRLLEQEKIQLPRVITSVGTSNMPPVLKIDTPGRGFGIQGFGMDVRELLGPARGKKKKRYRYQEIENPVMTFQEIFKL